MPHPEGAGCGNAVCGLHRRQAGLYGDYLRDKEPLAEVVDIGRKTKNRESCKVVGYVFMVDATKMIRTFYWCKK